MWRILVLLVCSGCVGTVQIDDPTEPTDEPAPPGPPGPPPGPETAALAIDIFIDGTDDVCSVLRYGAVYIEFSAPDYGDDVYYMDCATRVTPSVPAVADVAVRISDLGYDYWEDSTQGGDNGDAAPFQEEPIWSYYISEWISLGDLQPNVQYAVTAELECRDGELADACPF